MKTRLFVEIESQRKNILLRAPPWRPTPRSIMVEPRMIAFFLPRISEAGGPANTPIVPPTDMMALRRPNVESEGLPKSTRQISQQHTDKASHAS